jgi:hypothetical protein
VFYLWKRLLTRWAMMRQQDTMTKLQGAIETAVADKRWTSLPDGTTFCNLFCQEIAHAFGCYFLDGLAAREMGERIISEIGSAGDGVASWQEVAAQRAVDMAKADSFVLGWAPILDQEHGHVVVVAPEDMEQSDTFGSRVPMCASIAKYPFSNRVMKVSEAYRVANKPRYFLWTQAQ